MLKFSSAISTETPSKVQSAVQFVTRGIQSGLYPPGEILPPIRKLAVQSRVSLVTMWKAVNLLRRSGHLTGRAGAAPHVAGQAILQGATISECAWPIPGAADSGVAQDRVIARIRKDILNGRYQPGAFLPPVKQLEAQYRTSTRSLRGVLSGLCAQGLLEAGGRGFAVPRFSCARAGAAIGLLAFELYLEHYYMGMPDGHDYIRDTQLYASQAGLRLIVEPYRRSGGPVLHVDTASPLFSAEQTPGILGYIHILSEASDLDPLLKRLVGQNKPVSILEQNGYWQFPDWLRRYPVMVIPVGVTRICGEVVGRLLLSLGHKRVAFISPYDPNPWSINRFKGLSTAFAQAGLPEAVLPHIINFHTWFTDEKFRGDPSSVPRIKLEWPVGYESTALREATHSMEARLQGKVDSLIIVRNALRGLFERALKDRHITAWVGANDQVAVLALEFLREHGVKVPQEISVASFDDTYLATANQLTSYNFNIPAIMGAAVRHILQSSSLPSAKRAKIVHIDGMVIERRTTGPAA